MDNRPIGVFDSGFGGLSAVRELVKLMPEEDIIYFGDTARVPYGTRSRETLLKYARQDAAFLMTHDVKLIVVACGTVSSIAFSALEASLPIPVIGVVKPAAEEAVNVTNNKKIAVWGTSATIKSASFVKALGLYSGVEVCQVACPLLVPLVENGYIKQDSEITRLAIREYLMPVKDFGADTLILGCTHFPLISPLIEDEWHGTQINSGRQVAKEAKIILDEKGLRSSAPGGHLTICSSDDMEVFRPQAEIFLYGYKSHDIADTDGSLPVIDYCNRIIDIEDY
ncbi:MAG: glutamate racemase [Oscillospiraceae bacterium]|nr:glutamate racemase [Oscillospiraceae bacterium]